MILPDVDKVDMEMARDFLYMFGDLEPLNKILRAKNANEAKIKKESFANRP